MTALEKLRAMFGNTDDEFYTSAVELLCPDDFGFLEKPERCPKNDITWNADEVCPKCWDREIPEKETVKVYAMNFDTPNANLSSFPKGVRLEPGYTIDKDGKVKILEISIVRDEEKEKDMTVNKVDCKCCNCAHFTVCSLKEEFMNAQAAVDRVEVPRDNQDSISLNQIKWIKPVKLDCIHFMEACPTLRYPSNLTEKAISTRDYAGTGETYLKG